MLTKYILLLLIINCYCNSNYNHISTNNIKLLSTNNKKINLILKNESSVIKKLSRTIEKEEVEYNKIIKYY